MCEQSIEPAIIVGKLEKMECKHFCYTWKIENFCPCINCFKVDRKSPDFVTDNDDDTQNTWYLELIENCNCLKLILRTCPPDAILDVVVKLSVFGKDNQIQGSPEFADVIFTADSIRIMESRIINHKALQTKICDLIPNGNLTILCEIIHKDYTKYKEPQVDRTLSGDMTLAFNNKAYSDLTIIAGEEEFYVHKVIIAFRSSYLKKLVDAHSKDSQKASIHIADTTPIVMRHLLSYIYTSRIDNLNEDMAFQLIGQAYKYNLDGLVSSCAEIMSENLKSTNVFEILILAEHYKLVQLKEAAIDFIVNNIKSSIDSTGFKLLKPNHLGVAEEILRSIANRQHN